MPPATGSYLRNDRVFPRCVLRFTDITESPGRTQHGKRFRVGSWDEGFRRITCRARTSVRSDPVGSVPKIFGTGATASGRATFVCGSVGRTARTPSRAEWKQGESPDSRLGGRWFQTRRSSRSTLPAPAGCRESRSGDQQRWSNGRGCAFVGRCVRHPGRMAVMGAVRIARIR